MSNLANPGTFRSTFASYAEAQAASVLAPITRITVGNRVYDSDATCDALVNTGGTRNWAPAVGDTATLAHWGIEGTFLWLGPQGQLNEPSAVERARIVAAINWCSQNGRKLKGNPDRVYGLDGPLWIGNAPDFSVRNGFAMGRLNLFVKSWTGVSMGDMTGSDPDAFNGGPAVINIGSAIPRLHGFELTHVRIDCNRMAGTGIRVLHATSPKISHIRVDRAVNIGVDVGRPASGGNPAISVTDGVITDVTTREFWFSSDPTDGYTDWSVRTSIGVRIGGSDCHLRDSTLSTSKYCMVLGQGFNVTIADCAFWGNPTGVGEPGYSSRRTVWVSRYAHNYLFDNCRGEDGQIYIEGARVPVGGGGTLPAFHGSVIGCSFSQFDSPQIVLVAHEADETATSFRFIGNYVQNEHNASLVAGAGNWLANGFAGEISGNTKRDGSSFSFGGKALVQGNFEVLTNGRIRFPAVVTPPDASTPGRAGEVMLGSNGKLYTHTGTGAWRDAATGTEVT